MGGFLATKEKVVSAEGIEHADKGASANAQLAGIIRGQYVTMSLPRGVHAACSGLIEAFTLGPMVLMASLRS
jgi:hypothetical protein